MASMKSRDIYTKFKVIRAHIKDVHLNQLLDQNNKILSVLKNILYMD